MPIRFSWDIRNAAGNARQHGVSFQEAATAFADPLSLTAPDPDHSGAEVRFVLVGLSNRTGSWLSRTSSATTTLYDSSVLGSPPVENGVSMKKATSKRPRKASRPPSRRAAKNDMRAEYDFSGGVRGKYAALHAQGTNLVLLDPDVAAEFGDAKAVNRALRAYLKERSKRRTA